MTRRVTPTGVDHVAVGVPDVPGAVAFYTEKLGLVLDATRPDFGIAGAWLETTGGAQIHLIEGPAPDAGQTRDLRHFALAFDDLAETVTELRARGLEVTDPVEVGTTGRRQALTSDPWGNRVELHQRSSG